MKFVSCMSVYLACVLIFVTAAESRLALALARARGRDRNRTERDVSCKENLEYSHGDICCLNCPAGTHVKTSCLSDVQRGVCEPCEFDTYTEHDNGLRQCLPCTKCRSDQESTKKCNITQDTQCQCKAGSFCAPDQACEVCKKCSRCKGDDETTKSCTTNSNTVCQKRSPAGSSVSGDPYLVVAIMLVLMVISGLVVTTVSCFYWKRSKRRAVTYSNPVEKLKIYMDDDRTLEDLQNGQNADVDDALLEQGQAVGAEDEDKGLGPSLPNTANTSQSSLSAQPSAPPLPSPAAREDDKPRRLIPLNGDESLKKCFDLFEDVDVHYHNRFFRQIGLSDNAIKSAETLPLEDKVYELLKIWMEKEGMKADLNALIEALLYLDQKLSAENIASRAISNGYFRYEDE